MNSLAKRINELKNSVDPITVCLIGCGGTGSYVAYNLCKIDKALRALGHPGLMILLFDADHITPSNIGRQVYVNSNIGQNKASILATQLNVQYNTSVIANPLHITDKLYGFNVYISCVDNNISRYNIYRLLKKKSQKSVMYRLNRILWLDFGNGQDYGQICLSVLNNRTILQDNFKSVWPKRRPVDSNEPSCSYTEAILKQDIFINSILADIGSKALYDIIRTGQFNYKNIFLNLKTLKISYT